MAIPFVTVNYTAVLVASVVGMIIGAIWYGPLFGKAWMKLSRLSPKDMAKMKKKGMGKGYLAMFIGLLVMNFVLAHMLKFAQAATVAEAVVGGVLIWLGFIATVMLGSVLWEGKPISLYAINAFHYLVILAVSGAILVSWA